MFRVCSQLRSLADQKKPAMHVAVLAAIKMVIASISIRRHIDTGRGNGFRISPAYAHVRPRQVWYRTGIANGRIRSVRLPDLLQASLVKRDRT